MASIYDIGLRLKDFRNNLGKETNSEAEFDQKSINEFKKSIVGDNVIESKKTLNHDPLWHTFLINSSFVANAEKLMRTDAKSGGKVTVIFIS